MQERGLYFPDQWNEDGLRFFRAMTPASRRVTAGYSLRPWGSGWFVYTGYSFFRELPGRGARSLPAFRELDIVRASRGDG